MKVKKDYSQFGEETIIRRYFNKYPPAHKIVVDVGAYMGHHSNSYGFMLDGWKGILFEPTLESFQQIKRKCKGLNFQAFNCAIGLEDGYADFYVGNAPGHNTLSKYHAQPGVKKVNVRVKTLEEMLTKLSVPRRFGLLSIDVEGLDTVILYDFLNKTKYQPDVIIYEHKSDVKWMHQSYQLIYKNDANTILGRKRPE